MRIKHQNLSRRFYMSYFDPLWWNGSKWGTVEEFKGQSYSSHRHFRSVAQLRRAMNCAPEGDWEGVAIYRVKGQWIQKTWTPRKTNQ